MLTALSHLKVMFQNCHREEGARGLTRRCERSERVLLGCDLMPDWAAAPGLEAMRLLRSARNDKGVGFLGTFGIQAFPAN